MTVSRIRLFLMLALLVLCAPLGAARSQPAADDVLRATLANGLRVVIVRNTLAPVVETSVNYLVGSDEAPDGFPGTAHALEHMMFRGSPGLTADQLAAIGSAMGGNFNANTRESLTQYYFTVPSGDLDLALHIDAIRMQAVLATDKDWSLERGAIEQEVASDMSVPTYRLYEEMRQALFVGTPYAHTPLGTRPSFDKTSAEMLKDFYDRWYAPNNAILVIVGDLDPASALAKVKALFGPIQSKTLPARPSFAFGPVEPATLSAPTTDPYAMLMLAMRMPGLDSADFPALEVLSDVLSSERYDLYGLVPAGKALSAGFYLQPLPKASVGVTYAAYPAGGDAKAVEAELRQVLQNLLRNGVPADLVAAAKLQERRATEFQKNSISGLASDWADAVALYRLKSPDEDLQRIEKVTVADVNRVARKYLDLDHAIVATTVPEGSGKPVRGRGFGGQESIAMGAAGPTALPGWAEAALGRLAVPPSTIAPVVSTFPNGLTLIVQPESISDTVSVYGHIRNRAETEEPKGKEGVAGVLGQLFSYGSTHLDRLAFQAALDSIGASESAGTDFSLQVLARDFDRGTALLADNELNPALPQQAFDTVRAQTVQYVTARNVSPGYLASRALGGALLPPGDPDLRETTPATVGALTLDDVRAYYHETFRPDLATIVVMGRITPAAARAIIGKYFGGWTAAGPKPETDLPTVPDNRAAVIAVPDPTRVQDRVVMAHTLAMTIADPDYYALSLGNTILSGGLYSARLSVDLRKNSGLVYGVGSSLSLGRTRGAYAVQYACDPGNVSKAAAIVVRDIKELQDTPVGDAELQRAKALRLRQIPLGEASVDAIAGGILARRDLDLPLDEPTIAARHFIALDAGAIEAAFRKWLRPDDFVRVSQGPAPQ